MEPSKDEIKAWLKKRKNAKQPHSREWLGQQCGGINKRTVDNWLSSPVPIPSGPLTIIGRLMEDDRRTEELQYSTEKPLQNLVLEVDIPTFERWCRAALHRSKIITDYAILAIEEAAAKDTHPAADIVIETEGGRVIGHAKKYPAGEESLHAGEPLPLAAEKPPKGP